MRIFFITLVLNREVECPPHGRSNVVQVYAVGDTGQDAERRAREYIQRVHGVTVAHTRVSLAMQQNAAKYQRADEILGLKAGGTTLTFDSK